MKTDASDELAALREENKQLRAENEQLRQKLTGDRDQKTVLVPEQFAPVFDRAEAHVRACFDDFYRNPGSGEVMVGGERYLLFNSASLSYEFLDIMQELYSNRPVEEALRIGNNFRFDIAHVLGKKDALSFHTRMHLRDPIEKLSAGPVHFAYTGWANVEILPESNPSPDEHFFLKYYHHNSFEAQAWKKAGRHPDIPVCTMSCGYSSGWCEESFGIPLTAVELECEAAGAERCLFVMAPPSRIADYLPQAQQTPSREQQFDVPVFFERKYTEERLRSSLDQKELLLSEVHHRVKNNLQIISSLLKLQMDELTDPQLREAFQTGVRRIKAMALIHEMMYSGAMLSDVLARHFFRHLFLSLAQLHDWKEEPEVDLQTGEELNGLSPDKAITCGLLFNEVLHTLLQSGSGQHCKLLFRTVLNAQYYTVTISLSGSIHPMNNLPHSMLSLLSEQLEAQCTHQVATNRITFTIQFAC